MNIDREFLYCFTITVRLPDLTKYIQAVLGR